MSNYKYKIYRHQKFILIFLSNIYVLHYYLHKNINYVKFLNYYV